MQGSDSKFKISLQNKGPIFGRVVWDLGFYALLWEALKVLTKVLRPQLYLPLAEDSATSQ